MAHVKNIFKAFLNLPCLSLPKERYWMVSIVSQHFVWYPDSKAALPVMVVNVDELALLSAIEFNSEHANWGLHESVSGERYSWVWAASWLYPEFEIKAAVQLIKGKYSSKKELWKSLTKSTWKLPKRLLLCVLSQWNSIPRSFSVVVAFYHVSPISRRMSNDWVSSKCRSLNPVKNGRERTRTYCSKTSISQ